VETAFDERFHDSCADPLRSSGHDDCLSWAAHVCPPRRSIAIQNNRFTCPEQPFYFLPSLVRFDVGTEPTAMIGQNQAGDAQQEVRNHLIHIRPLFKHIMPTSSDRKYAIQA